MVVESPPGLMGCRGCGVVASSHGRRNVVLVDAPCFGRPVRGVAQADLALWRAGVSGRDVHRDRRGARDTSGVADHAGVLVGDRADAS